MTYHTESCDEKAVHMGLRLGSVYSSSERSRTLIFSLRFKKDRGSDSGYSVLTSAFQV